MPTQIQAFDPKACLQAAAAIEAGLAELAAALTEAQFHAPPRAGGWSVGYCIEHLLLTGHAFLPRWDAAIDEARKRQLPEGDTLRYSWLQRKFLEYAENPSAFRSKTAPALVPYSRHSVDETVARFLAMHGEFVRRLARCHGFDVRRVKVQSPFSAWIRYELGFSFDFALAHERRHLSQAWQVRKQLLAESQYGRRSRASQVTIA